MRRGALADGPIFIVGSVHTGTTLVSNVLSRHPDVYGGMGESCFFHHHSTITKQFSNLADEQQCKAYILYLIKLISFGYNHAGFKHSDADFERLHERGLKKEDVESITSSVFTSSLHDYTSIFGSVNHHLAAHFGKTRWREKTPGHLHHIGRIIEKFPNAYIIELVRDPRDVLASKQKRRTKNESKQPTEIARKQRRSQKAYDPFLDSLSWKAAIGVGNAAHKQFHSQILRLRYEDFVSEPSVQTQALCDFLALPYTPDTLTAMLNVGWTNTTIIGQHGSGGIGTKSIEKWKKELDRSDVAMCQLLVGAEMKKLTYLPQKMTIGAYLSLPMLLLQSGVKLLSQVITKPRRFAERYNLGRLSSLTGRMFGQTRKVGEQSMR